MNTDDNPALVAMATPQLNEPAAVEQTLALLLKNFLAELGQGRRFTLESSLERELGLGSLERVELLSRLEAEFRRRLPDAVMAEAVTVGDLLRALLAAEGRTAPERLLARFEALAAPLARPETAENLLEALQLHAFADPDRRHLTVRAEDDSERSITYGHLARRAAGIARELERRGVGPGDRVALMLPTCEEFFYCFAGIQAAQAVPVPLYPPFRADRIADFATRQAAILRNAEAVMLITQGAGEALGELLRPAVPSLAAVVGTDALEQQAGWMGAPAGGNLPAMIQYTSGSTGDPKGVLLTHANLLANIRADCQAIEITPQDVVVSWAPLYHDMGLIGCWLLPMYFGIPVTILSPLAFLRRPERWLWAIHEKRATLSAAPNFAYELCARKIPEEALEGLDLSCWRLALNGAEAVQPRTLERFTARFSHYGFRPEALLPVYGLAESTVGLVIPRLGRPPRIDRVRREKFEREGRAEPAGAGVAHLEFVSVGVPLPGHEIRIVDDQIRPLEERMNGRIQFRGPSSMSGYFRRPDATEAITFNGWLDTGDVGYRADGELFITGRRKDLILKAGRNLYPPEIEAAVAEVAGIRKGCVIAFGVADASQGTERLVVVAETREQEAEAQERLRGEINQKMLDTLGLPADDIVLVSPGQAPKTSSGKLRRDACRQGYLAGELSVRPPPALWQWGRLALSWLPHAAGRSLGAAGRLLYGVWFWGMAGTLGVACGLLLRATPAGERSAALVRRVARLMLRLAGIRLTVEGLEHLPAGPALVVSNHASYIDVLLWAAALPRRVVVVSKREIADIPLMGIFIRQVGHLLVERGDAARSLTDIEQVAETLRQGTPVLSFAEGTFTPARGLRPFRLGSFQAAARAGCPVVPAALVGSRHILRDGTWLPRRGPARVVLRPPIRPEGDGFREALRLREAAFAEILAHCGEPKIEVTSAAVPAATQ